MSNSCDFIKAATCPWFKTAPALKSLLKISRQKEKKKCLGLIELDPLRPPSPHPSMLSEMYGCIIQWALLYLWGAQLSGWEAASSYRRSPAVLRQARQRCTLGCAHTLCQNTLFLLDNLRVTLCAVCRPSHHGEVRISTPVTPPRGPSCVRRWLLAPP